MKHTSGPWKCAEAVVSNAPNCFVVTIGKWGAPNIAVVDNKANAALIAAAPEMLELLKAALVWSEKFMSTSVFSEKTKAVIAKATDCLCDGTFTCSSCQD